MKLVPLLCLILMPALAQAGESCVWQEAGPGEAAAVDHLARRAWREAAAEELSDWSLQVAAQTARLTLTGTSCTAILRATVNSRCGAGFDWEPVDQGCPDPTLAAALKLLAAQWPLAVVAPAAAGHQLDRSLPRRDWSDWLFLLAAAAVLALAAAAPASWQERRGLRRFLLLLLLLLLARTAIPVLLLPPAVAGAALHRTVYHILGNPFTDPGHPPLIFLLIRPVAALSVHPAALRAVPLLLVIAQLVLIFRLALVLGKRPGHPAWPGPLLAGTLAGAWFTLQVPQLAGLLDLSDWDLGRTLILALALLYQRAAEETQAFTRRHWGATIALLLLAPLSTWAAVPAVAVAGLFFLLAARRRGLSRRWLLSILVVGAASALAIALLVLILLMPMRGEIPPGSLAETWLAGWEALPLGGNPVMAVLCALGLISLVRDRTPLSRFMLAIAATTILSLFALSFFTMIPDRALQLLTPLLCLYGALTAVAAVRALTGALIRRWGSEGRPLLPRIAVALAAGALATTFYPGLPVPTTSDEPGQVAAQVLQALARGRQVAADDPQALRDLVLYEELLAGRIGRESLARWGERVPLDDQLEQLEAASCRPAGGTPESYLAVLLGRDPVRDSPCRALVEEGLCRPALGSDSQPLRLKRLGMVLSCGEP